MKLSVEWLRDWIDPNVDVDSLAERFTSVGLVVDDVSSAAEGVAGVVVGHVVEVGPHPNADRLSLCRVFDGQQEVQVVCGAPNVRQGMYAPFAPVGVTLPGGLTLRKAKIRGEHSFGMLCSAVELGLGEDASGILDLGEGAEAGRPLADHLGLDDTVMEVDVPYNRPDWLAVRGIAREASAIFGSSLRDVPSSPDEAKESAEGMIRIDLDDREDCPLYGARVVRNVRIGPSPDWLSRRLESIGQRSINNVVDATNYILFTYGQPIHAFDYDRLQGDIKVRRARKGETLVTLDDQKRALDEEMLLITDASGPIALAGVMGGASTEVTDATTTILIESALFDAARVQHASRVLGLESEAATRFTRGIDAGGVLEAMDAVARLIAEVADGEVLSGRIVAGDEPAEPAAVSLRTDRITHLLGKSVPDAEVRSILERLGFRPEAKEEVMRCAPPSWRHDVTREVDLIEEVARYHGYDAFDERQYNGGAVSAAAHPTERAIERSLDVWRALGFQEILTTAFQREEEARETAGWSFLVKDPVVLRNAKSAEASALRTALLPAQLRVALHNINHGVNRFRLVEHGKVYGMEDGVPVERWEMAGVVAGPLVPAGWSRKEVPFDFFTLKGFLETWSERHGEPLVVERAGAPHPFDPEMSALVRVAGADADVGRIDPAIASKWDLPPDLFLFSVDFESVMSVDRDVTRYRPASRFPSVKRDLAFVVGDAVTNEELTRAITTAGGQWIGRVRLFDHYRGKPIPAGKKSLAYALTFQSAERNLTNEEVDEAVGAVVRRLEKDFGAELRDA